MFHGVTFSSVPVIFATSKQFIEAFKLRDFHNNCRE